MKLKIKKLHPDAIIPQYQTDGAACFDLHVVNIGGISINETSILKKHGVQGGMIKVDPGTSVSINTGLSFEIPNGYAMLIYGRSGHAFNYNVRLVNCVAVIDSDFRGEVIVKLKNDGRMSFDVWNGDRIAQAMLVQVPRVELVEVEELSDTERGTGGFGSTGA